MTDAAQVAYKAYRESSNGHVWEPWETLDPHERHTWQAVADAVRDSDDLDRLRVFEVKGTSIERL